MGLSASKRVNSTFKDSSEFNSACDSVFDEFVALTQGAFQGVLPYQLSDASGRLHQRLSQTSPVLKRWAPSPPSQAQVDRAYRSLHPAQAQQALGHSEFKAFALNLFTNTVISSAAKELAAKVPIGVAGIAGIGIATKVQRDLIGAAVGVYAIGIATSIYLRLA